MAAGMAAGSVQQSSGQRATLSRPPGLPRNLCCGTLALHWDVLDTSSHLILTVTTEGEVIILTSSWEAEEQRG